MNGGGLILQLLGSTWFQHEEGVRQWKPGIQTYFYDENIPSLARDRTWMSAGVGDAPSWEFYYASI